MANRPLISTLLCIALFGCDEVLPEPETPVADAAAAPEAEPATDPDEPAEDAEAFRQLLEAPRPKEPPPTERTAEAEPPPKRRPPRTPAPKPEPAGPPQLSDGAFQSVVNDWGGMKRCLESTSRLGSPSGALQVAFTIRGDGQVVKSRVVDASNEVARSIAPCVERNARRLKFPAFAAASEETEKTAKFVF